MSARTAGPWRVASSSNYPFSVDGRLNIDAEQRGYVCLAGDRDDAEAVANAHLIAASPELLDALKAMVASYDGIRDGLTSPVVIAKLAAADAAIAKAEGR